MLLLTQQRPRARCHNNLLDRCARPDKHLIRIGLDRGQFKTFQLLGQVDLSRLTMGHLCRGHLWLVGLGCRNGSRVCHTL